MVKCFFFCLFSIALSFVIVVGHIALDYSWKLRIPFAIQPDEEAKYLCIAAIVKSFRSGWHFLLLLANPIVWTFSSLYFFAVRDLHTF